MTIPLLLHFALIRAHVLQRPFRTLLSIAGVALGVLASVAIGTANMQVLRSFEQAVTTVAGPATLEVTGHDLGVDESAITAVRAVEGVVSAAPVIEEAVVVAEGSRVARCFRSWDWIYSRRPGRVDFRYYRVTLAWHWRRSWLRTRCILAVRLLPTGVWELAVSSR